MAETSITLQDLLHKAGIDQTQFLKDSLEWLLQQLMEADVSTQIGVERHERTADRTTRRNGYRERPWDTRLGSSQCRGTGNILDLGLPRLEHP